MIKMQTNSLK